MRCCGPCATVLLLPPRMLLHLLQLLSPTRNPLCPLAHTGRHASGPPDARLRPLRGGPGALPGLFAAGLRDNTCLLLFRGHWPAFHLASRPCMALCVAHRSPPLVLSHSLQGSTSFDSYISILEKVTGQVSPCRAAAGQSMRLPRPLQAACCGCLPQLGASTLHESKSYLPTSMQDFVLFLYSTMSRTIMEIFSEASRHVAAQMSACAWLAPNGGSHARGQHLWLPRTEQLGRCPSLTHPPTCPSLSSAGRQRRGLGQRGGAA